MINYRSNPPASPVVGPGKLVRLSKRDLKTLRVYSRLDRWPAKYLESGHPDNCLIDLGFLEVKQIDGEGRFVNITLSGRATVSNVNHQ